MKKIVLITGSSRGIGAETAYKLSENGYAICINYRTDEVAAKKVINKILNNGGEAISIKADISIEKEVVDLFNQIDKQLGMITALVNNAGILKEQSILADMSAERIIKVFNTNVRNILMF